MPSLGIVGFEDTTVIRGSGQTYDTSSTLRVGDIDAQAATLLRIPLTDIPNLQNARVEVPNFTCSPNSSPSWRERGHPAGLGGLERFGERDHLRRHQL